MGYDIDGLIAAIRAHLDWEQPHTAALLGAGALGSAILGYDEFAEYGLAVEAVFDVDESKIGTTVHGHPILALSRLPEVFRERTPELAILCVPAAAAQDVADLRGRRGRIED